MTQRKKNGQFLPGGGGRKPGSRNKLHGDGLISNSCCPAAFCHRAPG